RRTPGRARASRSARWRSSKLLLRRLRRAQPLEPGATLLCLQPALARCGGRARGAPLARPDAGAPYQLDQPIQRILPVARLGAMALRIDHQHALAREATAGKPRQPPPNRVGRARLVDVEAKLHRGRDLVDVLPAGSRGPQEALLDVALVDQEAGGDANHAGHSIREDTYQCIPPCVDVSGFMGIFRPAE